LLRQKSETKSMSLLRLKLKRSRFGKSLYAIFTKMGPMMKALLVDAKPIQTNFIDCSTPLGLSASPAVLVNRAVDIKISNFFCEPCFTIRTAWCEWHHPSTRTFYM